MADVDEDEDVLVKDVLRSALQRIENNVQCAEQRRRNEYMCRRFAEICSDTYMYKTNV